MKKRTLNPIKGNAGITLVELIVTFALIGLFMTAASFVLSNSLRMFQRMESTSKAVTVSDLILDKISGEIAAADVERADKEQGYYFWLGGGADDPESNGSQWVAFCNRSKSPISIYQSDGRLIIKYYAISDGNSGGNVVKPVEEIDWKFDDNVYMGFKIESLTFSRPQPVKRPNVICIDLKLKHERTGFTYSAYRYASNYNYDGTGKRITMRNDGKAERPSEAVEFTYPADWEAEEPTNPTDPITPTEPPAPVEYTINFYSINEKISIAAPIVMQGKQNEQIIVDGSSKSTAGKTVIGPFPIKYYEYVPEDSSDECILDGIKSSGLELYYKPSDTDLFTFKVISRVKQEDGSHLYLHEEVYERKIESQFALTPENERVNNGKTYKCLSSALNFKVGVDGTNEYYFDYELFNEDEYFQGVIPLDPTGWWRTPDIPVNESNGKQWRIINPGGISKWETPDSSYYYVVIKQISGTGYNTQAPSYFNETHVIKISDLEILNYEKVAPSLRPEQGSEFHARVFSYDGNYYVRLGYRNPLGSPETQPSEWYKLP